MTPRRKKIAYLVLVALQIALLAAMIARRVHLLRTGRTVLLRCEPVDPRSLLSGDYVVLNFSISRFSRDEVKRLACAADPGERCGEVKLRHHDRIYVALDPTPGAPTAKAVAIARDPERLRRYPVVLRGTVRESFNPAWTPSLQVRYGVEQYFVPQHEGRRIEGQLGKTWVEVAVASSGESAIRRLFISGREVEFR
jgi:uncharacterized membrane-anchored protein